MKKEKAKMRNNSMNWQIKIHKKTHKAFLNKNAKKVILFLIYLHFFFFDYLIWWIMLEPWTQEEDN